MLVNAIKSVNPSGKDLCVPLMSLLCTCASLTFSPFLICIWFCFSHLNLVFLLSVPFHRRLLLPLSLPIALACTLIFLQLLLMCQQTERRWDAVRWAVNHGGKEGERGRGVEDGWGGADLVWEWWSLLCVDIIACPWVFMRKSTQTYLALSFQILP